MEPIGVVEEDDARQVSRSYCSIYNSIQILDGVRTLRGRSAATLREICKGTGAGLALPLSLRDRSMPSGAYSADGTLPRRRERHYR